MYEPFLSAEQFAAVALFVPAPKLKAFWEV